MANLILTDRNDNAYNFPDSFWLQDGGVLTNQNIVNRSFAAGGQNVADGFLQARVITISGFLQGDTIAVFETKKRALIQAALKGGLLSRSEDSVYRYIDLKYADIQLGIPGGEGDMQLQEITLIFRAEFPFWEDTTETESENIVSGDETLTIAAGDSDNIIQPIIEIEANQAADIPSIKMINRSDGATEFFYDESLFVQGDILEIDTKQGTVKRNGGNVIENFSGYFLRLQPGNNEIDYEGAACTIRFKFRKIYI